jgi:hypothetical protein
MQFYSDGWGGYERHIEPVFYTVGKRHTQKIERKHLKLPPRITAVLAPLPPNFGGNYSSKSPELGI